jgi:hypothetical protein
MSDPQAIVERFQIEARSTDAFMCSMGIGGCPVTVTFFGSRPSSK